MSHGLLAAPVPQLAKLSRTIVPVPLSTTIEYANRSLVRRVVAQSVNQLCSTKRFCVDHFAWPPGPRSSSSRAIRSICVPELYETTTLRPLLLAPRSKSIEMHWCTLVHVL